MSVTPEQLKNRANLKIRTDREAGLVSAEIVFIVDGKPIPQTIQLAAFNVSAFDLDVALYEEFVKLCKKSLFAFTADMNKTIMPKGVAFEREVHSGKPKDMN